MIRQLQTSKIHYGNVHTNIWTLIEPYIQIQHENNNKIDATLRLNTQLDAPDAPSCQAPMLPASLNKEGVPITSKILYGY